MAAQVKLAQCTAASGDMPAAIALLRPLLAEHEAQYADLFIEIGDFLFLRGESAEVRPWWIGCENVFMRQADMSGGSASHDCAAAAPSGRA